MTIFKQITDWLKSLFKSRPEEDKPETTADAPKRTDKIYRRKDDWS